MSTCELLFQWVCTIKIQLSMLVLYKVNVVELVIKILANSNQQTQSCKFTSHIAAFFLCGFDHRDAWNLHTNIIWSKCSTDFKELSPCSVWYHLNHKFNNRPCILTEHFNGQDCILTEHFNGQDCIYWFCSERVGTNTRLFTQVAMILNSSIFCKSRCVLIKSN